MFKVVINVLSALRFLNMPANVLGLCEVADLKVQILILAQMYIKIPNVELRTEPAILQNPC